jgi:hypothetical protein
LSVGAAFLNGTPTGETIAIVSPVAGLRPYRAARSATTKLPKAAIATFWRRTTATTFFRSTTIAQTAATTDT